MERTPLPFKKILILSLILFANAFMNTMLLPFIAFMVLDFRIPELEVGKYSGYLLSSFMLGQLLCSYLWGVLSDKVGRRPVLLAALSLSSIGCLSFGFSTNYKMAIIIRFLTGSFNGINSLIKE